MDEEVFTNMNFQGYIIYVFVETFHVTKGYNVVTSGDTNDICDSSLDETGNASLLDERNHSAAF